jgi:hypothetical protein
MIAMAGIEGRGAILSWCAACSPTPVWKLAAYRFAVGLPQYIIFICAWDVDIMVSNGPS